MILQDITLIYHLNLLIQPLQLVITVLRNLLMIESYLIKRSEWLPFGWKLILHLELTHDLTPLGVTSRNSPLTRLLTVVLL